MLDEPNVLHIGSNCGKTAFPPLNYWKWGDLKLKFTLEFLFFAMDEHSNHIHNLLLNSLSAAQEVRKEAEKSLQGYSHHEGFLSVLLGLVLSSHINPTAKQAGNAN